MSVSKSLSPDILCNKIADSPLSRVIKRAGVRRQSGDLPNFVKRITFTHFLLPFVSRVAITARHNSRKTLIPNDINTACSMSGIELAMGLNITDPSKTKGLYGCKNRGKKPESTPMTNNGEVKKKRRKRPGTASLQHIKRLHKDSDCLELPLSNFNAVIKEIASVYIENVRFRDGTSKLIQLITEDWIYNLALKANVAACHRDAQTVTSNDIKLVLFMIGKISAEEWKDFQDADERDNIINEILEENDEILEEEEEEEEDEEEEEEYDDEEEEEEDNE